MNPFSLQETDQDKLSILDIKARDQSGRRFNIEMQMIGYESLPQRFLYYWARLYQDQIQKGEDYANLQPTISICFLNSILFPQTADYYLPFHLWNRENDILLSKDLGIHMVELPKFHQTVENLADPLEKWLYFLRNGAELDPDNLPTPLNVSAIKHATEELAMITKEARLKSQRDFSTMQRDFREEGLRLGKEQGIQLGKEEGREEGILLGVIQSYQEILGEVAPAQELSAKSVEDLEKLAAELKSRLQDRLK